MRNKIIMYLLTYGAKKLFIFLYNNPEVRRGLVRLVQKTPAYHMIRQILVEYVRHIKSLGIKS